MRFMWATFACVAILLQITTKRDGFTASNHNWHNYNHHENFIIVKLWYICLFLWWYILLMKSKIKNDKFRFLMDRFNGTILSFYKICKMRKKKKRIFTVWYVAWCICYCEQHFSGINAGYPMWPWPRTSRENFTPRPRSLSPTDTMRQQSGKGFLRIKKN